MRTTAAVFATLAGATAAFATLPPAVAGHLFPRPAGGHRHHGAGHQESSAPYRQEATHVSHDATGAGFLR